MTALLLINALLGDVLRYASERGIVQASIDLFGISLIVWLAAAAALALLAESEDSQQPARKGDWAIIALAVTAAFVPMGTASAAALTGLALYIYVSSDAGTVLRRAAAILASITAAILWGRVLLALFSRTFLRLDSALVSVFGVRSDENRLFFVRESGPMDPSFVVAPGCSSLHSISVALVFCTLVHAWFGIKPTPKTIAVGAIAIGAVIGINTLRLAAFAFFPQQFDAIHFGWIASIFAWSTIIFIVAIVGLGMKREILG